MLQYKGQDLGSHLPLTFCVPSGRLPYLLMPKVFSSVKGMMMEGRQEPSTRDSQGA